MKNDLVSEYMFPEEAACYLLTVPRKLALYRKYGLLKYAKLGKNFIYRKQWLDEFMEQWSGFDLSNEANIKLAINARKWKEKNHA